MKKWLAFTMVMALLLSCTLASANAESGWIDVTSDDPAAENMTAAKSSPDIPFLSAGDGRSAAQKTALWIRVDASGQINCTIPLVIVYKTNIDGGSATTAEDKYGITNYSTADLAVIGMKVETHAEDDLIELVESYAPTAVDKYKGTVTVAEKGTLPGYTKSLAALKAEDTKSAAEGGLFKISKPADANGEFRSIALQVATSRLSFVTGLNGEGVYLLDVHYTVGISTQNAEGTAISGETKGTVFTEDGPVETDYTYDGTGIVKPK